MSNLVFEKKLPGAVFQTYDSKPTFDLSEVNQVHGNQVVRASNNTQEADGLFSLDKPYCLAIKTADCLPIAMIGNLGVALLHAGWRGVKSGIFCSEEVYKLEPLHFFLGPAIHQENYEVQSDFLAQFPESENILKRDDQFYFDLFGEAIFRIKEAYPSAKVEGEDSPCTFASNNFNSYRRNKTTQRNWNILKSEL